MDINKHIRNFLFVLIVIYYAQGAIYKEGSFLSQGVLLLTIAISFIYFIKTLLNKRKKNFFFKTWTVLFLLNAVGYLFTGDYLEPIYFNLFKGIAVALLIFYPFYYFAQNEELNSKHLVLFLIVMIPVSILKFNVEKAMLISDGFTVLVNNTSYAFAFMIPYVFLIKKKKVVSMFTVLILMFFIIQANKRGALIVGSIGLLSFTYYQLKTLEKKNRLWNYIFIFLAMGALWYYGYEFFSSNEHFVERIQSIGEGNSSGRDLIYANIFSTWYNSDSFTHLLFGFGFADLANLMGIYAHNDWLQLLSDFGLMGVSVYFILFISAYKNLHNPLWSKDKKILLFTVVTMWLFTTFFSMHYLSIDSFFQSIMLAYLMGSNKHSIA